MSYWVLSISMDGVSVVSPGSLFCCLFLLTVRKEDSSYDSKKKNPKKPFISVFAYCLLSFHWNTKKFVFSPKLSQLLFVWCILQPLNHLHSPLAGFAPLTPLCFLYWEAQNWAQCSRSSFTTAQFRNKAYLLSIEVNY